MRAAQRKLDGALAGHAKSSQESRLDRLGPIRAERKDQEESQDDDPKGEVMDLPDDPLRLAITLATLL
jgi:hypothetical protein